MDIIIQEQACSPFFPRTRPSFKKTSETPVMTIITPSAGSRHGTALQGKCYYWRSEKFRNLPSHIPGTELSQASSSSPPDAKVISTEPAQAKSWSGLCYSLLSKQIALRRCVCVCPLKKIQKRPNSCNFLERILYLNECDSALPLFRLWIKSNRPLEALSTQNSNQPNLRRDGDLIHVITVRMLIVEETH